MQINEKALKNCPFCGKAMMLRGALWPSEGDTDAVIHAEPTDCPMYDFCDGTADGSIAEKWNRRALTSATPPDELSGNPGELIDKMADAIRGDTVLDDTPWETLSEDRKVGWRGDAERALAVVKEYLTSQAATALRLSAGGWRPMDSAPKDGTKILVWADGYEWPEVIYYEQYDDATADEVGEPGYWRYAEDLIDDVADVEFDTLSHWQPLPASPTVEAGHVE